MSRSLAVVTALVLAGALLPTGQAAAQDGGGGSSDGEFDDGEVNAGAGSTLPGSPGGSVVDPGGSNGGGSTVDRPVPPCRYVVWMSGAAMADYAASFVVPMWPAVPAGWEAHVADPGNWYKPECAFTSADSGTADTLDAKARVFYDANPPVFGAAPEVYLGVPELVERVQDSRAIPEPDVAVNPEAETVVGLRTWVWPTDEPAPVTARAESGPNWAQVTAVPGKLVVSADGAEVGSCDRPIAWSPGLPDTATDCYVTFRTSSARSGGATIEARISWTVTLTTSDGRNEVLEADYPAATEVDVDVAEVQSVLRQPR